MSRVMCVGVMQLVIVFALVTARVIVFYAFFL